MKNKIIFIFLISQLSGDGNHSSILSINNTRNEMVITIDPQIHIDYGLAYPMTYEFIIPSGSANLQTYRRFKSDQDWSQITEKTTNDFFNGIETVRFDYDENMAYVSIGFSDLSDSIFIKIADNEGNIINATYSAISQYYDNRDAVVTSTADDWGSWSNPYFVQTCEIFRSFNLWLSCSIITDFLDSNAWADIQNQLDSGYVEAVSHSRTHPYAPYDDLEGEVLGSKQDLIENLDLPDHSRYGIREYIYAWVAPYGNYDDDIDSMVSVAKYLVPRLYYENEHGFSNWNQDLYKYDPVGVSLEVGPNWGGPYDIQGTTDTVELNNTFDEVLADGGVYHVMCHPVRIDWENEDYPWVHLEHISNRNNIWYVGFGHLYAYHFLQSTYPNLNLASMGPNIVAPEQIMIYQNYPNPFNPTTTLRYDLPEDANVNIIIYDMMGRVVSNLAISKQNAGYKSIQWNATNNQGQSVSAGVYLYSIEAGQFRQTKKMILLK